MFNLCDLSEKDKIALNKLLTENSLNVIEEAEYRDLPMLMDNYKQMMPLLQNLDKQKHQLTA